jgi:predicted RNA-binding Zn ribbon-like protein
MSSTAGVPDPAAAIVVLLNSREHTIYPDKLASPEAAAGVLRALGASGGDVGALKGLRDDLMGVLTAVHDGEDTAPFWASFTEHVAGVAYRSEFGAPAVVTVRQVAGDRTTGRVARLVGELIEAGRWSRLRLCANDTCRSAFYDTTRSRTQRWHSYEICGNKQNVAAYRARENAAGA